MRANNFGKNLVRSQRMLVCVIAAGAALGVFLLAYSWGKGAPTMNPVTDLPPVSWHGYDALIAAQ